MSLEAFAGLYLPAVEAAMQRAVQIVRTPETETMHSMLAYHMGWEGPGAGPEARGKRIRPWILLLCTSAVGGDWQAALPAAAAVELVHNFSLIHDDIQDNSPLRRGRETLWKRWGIPQAINAGDAMFTQAHLALLDLVDTHPLQVVLDAARLLQTTCLHLTRGQYLDLSYEKRQDLSEADYWPMIGGKTAAMLACSTELGALVGGASPGVQAAYRRFGENLGLAFQVQDDLLGIWGDAALTGKSAESDLVAGKKSLPVLYGLDQRSAFASRWRQGPISPAEVPVLSAQLEAEGGRTYAVEKAAELTAAALSALGEAQPQGEAGAALYELTQSLLDRQN